MYFLLRIRLPGYDEEITVFRYKGQLERTVLWASERNSIVPTFGRQRDPSLVRADTKDYLLERGIHHLHPPTIIHLHSAKH